MAHFAKLQTDPNRWTAIDEAIANLRQQCEDMVVNAPTALRRATKMGDKSESFCRESVAVLGRHPQVLPPTFDLTDMVADWTDQPFVDIRTP